MMENKYAKTTDNNLGKFKISDENKSNLSFIANKTLKQLSDENPNVLIFPTKLGAHDDDIEKQNIFSLSENDLTTGNIMGFVGYNDTQLTISSRFYTNENDYFLHYMLQKVFALNIVDLPVSTKNDNIWDIFLLYLFPYYLQKAVNQGLYKEYERKQYNNANVKGAINVTQHIRQNTPFVGNIAYSTREYTYDNRITQLIRHTIEFIKTQQFGRSILNNTPEIRHNCNQITFATPNYAKQARQVIMVQNQKKVHHPYFTEYEILRRICLQILRKEGLTYGKKENEVYGLLFDGAWLWEEYLNTILQKQGFAHPENKIKKGAIYVFENDTSYPRYPDFYKKEEIVLDAKYKRMEGAVRREDIHQVIAYTHILKANDGGFIYPSDSITEKQLLGKLNGYGGIISKFPFQIPNNAENWSDFIVKIQYEEVQLTSIV